jgi:hypothetical protein
MHDLLVGDIAEVVLDRAQMPVTTTSTATYTLPGEGELSLVRKATRTLLMCAWPQATHARRVGLWTEM